LLFNDLEIDQETTEELCVFESTVVENNDILCRDVLLRSHRLPCSTLWNCLSVRFRTRRKWMSTMQMRQSLCSTSVYYYLTIYWICPKWYAY